MTTVRHRKYYSLLRSPGAEENMNNQRELISEKSCSFKKMKIIILSSCFNSCSSIIYYVHQKILMLLMTFFFSNTFHWCNRFHLLQIWGRVFMAILRQSNLISLGLHKITLWAYFGIHFHKHKDPSNNIFKILNKTPRWYETFS